MFLPCAGAIPRINRNIVECKCDCCPLDREEIVELIETLWNVNLGDVELSVFESNELIETLWNVNDSAKI